MNEHKNIITIEDEIKEFSDKPVKSSALYKKAKELESNAVPDASEASVGDVLSLDENKKPTWTAPSGGGSSFGKKIFSGTVTETPQPIEMTWTQLYRMPMYVGTINGEPIAYMEIETEGAEAYWAMGNDYGDDIAIGGTLEEIAIVGPSGCEVELIDMGPRFVAVPARLQESTINVSYSVDVLHALITAGCGLGLCVLSPAAAIGDGHSYAPIIFYHNDLGDSYFDAEIHIGNDQYTDWTVDAETGAITGTTGGSN